jgi:predicted porin
MKKSLLALAVFAFAGAASAQSSVTIFGKVDLGVGKPIGTRDKQVLDGGGSRLGFRGQEDLGGGLFAIFSFEHRFSPDTGVDTSTLSVSKSTPQTTFWNGHSWVGVRGGFGQVTLGRHYTPSFSLVQNTIDPWGGDTVASLRTIGTQAGTVGALRVSDSVRYDLSMAGVNFAASIGEADQAGTINDGPDRPWSVAANYAAGPFFVGVSYENPANTFDKLVNVGARYGFGPVTLRGAYSTGKTTTDATSKGWLLGATVDAGPGFVKVGFAQRKLAGVKVNSKFGLGYQYNMSKRTYLYADAARDSKVATSKTGYDFGIQHNF